MSAISELTETTRRIAEAVGPAVVRIGGGGGRGCGVVIGDGLVLTNAHNLRGHQASVTFADGRTATADTAGADLDADVAVLRVDTADIVAPEWATDGAEPGAVVGAVAQGAGGVTRTTIGQITATEQAFRGPRGRRVPGSIEHTAPMARGSSGSPLVDLGGQLLGLNTKRAGDGFYLAVPAGDALRTKVDALAAGVGSAPRHLGVAVAPAHIARKLRRSVGLPEHDGLLVRGVEHGGLGARADLREGDLIVRAADREVTHIDDLYEALDVAVDDIELVVLRGAEEVVLTVSFDPVGPA